MHFVWHILWSSWASGSVSFISFSLYIIVMLDVEEWYFSFPYNIQFAVEQVIVPH
uniref:Uncharacterized protein n=1 Tax=Rhizophora mucronata TaxID=61149 RepID=A0A2P2MMC1_RHIMU